MAKSVDKVDEYLDRIDHLPAAPMLVMDEATVFTAGLLHDLGKVILAVAANDIYADLRDRLLV